MRLIRLRGENIYQFPTLGPIYFPEEGIIGVIGPNGAGKTTLFKIKELLLYGVSKGSLQTHIKYQGSTQKDKWWGELIFEKDGNFYCVYRHEITSKATLERNGELVATGQREVTEYMIRHVLFMSQLSFSTCFYARQGEFDALVKMTDAKRKAEVTKLLRIDSIERAGKRVRQDQAKEKEAISHLQDSLSAEPIPAEELESLMKERDLYTLDRDRVDEELENLKAIQTQTLTEKQKSDLQYETHQRLQNDLTQVQSAIDTLSSHSLSKAEARKHQLLRDQETYYRLLPFRTEYTELMEQKNIFQQTKLDYQRKELLLFNISAYETEIDRFQQEYTSLTAALSSKEEVQVTLEKWSQEEKTLHTQLESLLKKYQGANYQKDEIEREINKNRQQMNKIEKIGKQAPCPTCERPLLDYFDQRISDYQQEYQELSDRLELTLSELSTLKKEGATVRSSHDHAKHQIIACQGKIAELVRVEDRMKMIESEQTKQHEKIEHAKKSLAPLENVHFDQVAFEEMENKLSFLKEKNDEIIRLEHDMKQISIVSKEIESIHASIKSNQERLSHLIEERDKMAFDLSVHQTLTQNLEASYKKVSEKEKEKERISAEIRVLSLKVTQLEERKERRERIELSIKEKEQKAGVLGLLDHLLDGYKHDKLERLSPILAQMMNELVYVLTDGRYHEVSIDKHFNISVKRLGVENPLWFYSGGETHLFALIQRIAISRLIAHQNHQSDFRLIALDEVMKELDAQRSHNFIVQLSQLRHLFNQVFIVTHSEHVKEMVTHTLEVYQDASLASHTRWLEGDSGEHTAEGLCRSWNEEEVRELADSIDQMRLTSNSTNK